ncbi:hypothetical protein [Micromonospora aurantiaca (nom. illeg.)]|uniref:hypothetical protein n=1 Tax=Micromonospora aurantiaca (nom. illeg.) TaxID=47850 RepID=UPI0033F54A36
MPTVVGATSGNSAAGTSTSFTTTFPGGWSAGDVAVLVGHVSATNLTMSTPAGWTAVPGPSWPVNESTNSRMYAWYRVLQGGDSAPTISNSGAVTGGWEMVVVTGVSPSTPLGQVATATASGSSIALPSVTGVAAGSLLLADVHARVASGTLPSGLDTATGYTEAVDHGTSRATGNANLAMGAQHATAATAGAYGGESVAVTNGVTASMIALLVELLAASTAWTADAAVAVTATLTAGAVRGTGGGASLPAVAALTATATVTRPAGAALTVTAALAALAARSTPADAALTVTAALTGTPVAVTSPAAATIDVTALLAGSGIGDKDSTSALAATATITAAAAAVRVVAGSVTATAALTVAALVTTRPAGTLTVTATLTAAPTVNLRAAAVLAALAALAVDARVRPPNRPGRLSTSSSTAQLAASVSAAQLTATSTGGRLTLTDWPGGAS